MNSLKVKMPRKQLSIYLTHQKYEKQEGSEIRRKISKCTLHLFYIFIQREYLKRCSAVVVTWAGDISV